MPSSSKRVHYIMHGQPSTASGAFWHCCSRNRFLCSCPCVLRLQRVRVQQRLGQWLSGRRSYPLLSQLRPSPAAAALRFPASSTSPSSCSLPQHRCHAEAGHRQQAKSFSQGHSIGAQGALCGAGTQQWPEMPQLGPPGLAGELCPEDGQEGGRERGINGAPLGPEPAAHHQPLAARSVMPVFGSAQPRTQQGEQETRRAHVGRVGSAVRSWFTSSCNHAAACWPSQPTAGPHRTWALLLKQSKAGRAAYRHRRTSRVLGGHRPAPPPPEPARGRHRSSEGRRGRWADLACRVARWGQAAGAQQQ